MAAASSAGGPGVRAARRSDLGALLEMMGADYRESGYPFDGERAAACFLQLLESPALGAVWVAEQEGAPVGYVVLTLGFSLEYGGRDAFVDDLFVRAEHRRLGLGRTLLDAALAGARAAGVRAVHLEVERSNPGARSLYEATGFADNDRRLLTLRLS
jgi:diamine N-acetyltransferase